VAVFFFFFCQIYFRGGGVTETLFVLDEGYRVAWTHGMFNLYRSFSAFSAKEPYD